MWKVLMFILVHSKMSHPDDAQGEYSLEGLESVEGSSQSALLVSIWSEYSGASEV